MPKRRRLRVTSPMPGLRRLYESGQAETLRQKVLEEQAAALAEAGQRRQTAGPADQPRDHPIWPATHYPEPKPPKRRRRR